MTRENKKFFLAGLWILLLSIIGIPQDWKTYAFILTGSIFVVLSARGGLIGRALQKANQAGEEVFVDSVSRLAGRHSLNQHADNSKVSSEMSDITARADGKENHRP